MGKSGLILVALVCASASAMAGEPGDAPLRIAAVDHKCGADVHLGQNASAAAVHTRRDAALTELLDLHTQAVEAQGGALLPRTAQR